MERDSLHGLHQPLSLYKSHIRNPIMEPFIISRPYYKSFSPSNFPSKGLLRAPPLSLLHSAPFSLQPPPQPPLLPLPASLSRRSSSCPGHSCSHTINNGNRKIRSSDHAFTLKKSTKSSTKNNINIPKKEEKKTPKTSSDTVTVPSTSKFGAKNITRVAHLDNSDRLKDVKERVEMLPGSAVFTISPPPSSLPLPSFSLRPKLSCNGVAARIDAGATDDLRRFLRLQ